MTAADSHADFPRTRWSLVGRLDASDSDDARAALAALVLHYWYPVYAYVRLSGHAPAVAQDIAQAFFQQLQQQYAEGQAARGSFRVWLLDSLRAFLARDWRELSGGKTAAATPDFQALERRYQRDCRASDSPEQAYQRSFALEVLARGCRCLRAEAREAGHLDMFEELRPYLARDPRPDECETMRLRLHSPAPALTIALKSLRLRLRELVCAELADAVTTREGMLAEQRVLYGVLRGDG